MVEFRAMAKRKRLAGDSGWNHALYDLVKSGSDYATSFLKYRSEIEVYREAQRVTGTFHTSSNELQAAGWHVRRD
jgi:hypothetical protein